MELIETGGPGFIAKLNHSIVKAASSEKRQALVRLRNYLQDNAD